MRGDRIKSLFVSLRCSYTGQRLVSAGMQEGFSFWENEMNEIIKIEERDGKQFVNARELHGTLGVGRDFTNWIKERIEKYGFLEGSDFTPVLAKSTGGRPAAEYMVSVDMAKELAMVENNEKGREVRQYLIKIESAWNTPEMIMARALQVASKTIGDQSRLIAEMAPKAAFHDAVTQSPDTLDFAQVAKVLSIPGMGRNNMLRALREREVLRYDNSPYQQYVDRGYFKQVEMPFTRGNIVGVGLKTVVFQKGVDFIRKELSPKSAKSVHIPATCTENSENAS